MPQQSVDSLVKEFVDGRTDLVFELLARGKSPNTVDEAGVSLLRWCAYYGDVSAIKFLLAQARSWTPLGRTWISMEQRSMAIGVYACSCSNREQM
jgi:ankyrin repeat protein